MKARRTFPADPHSVTAARRFATEALADLPAEVRQSVELMVSELATNGIRHGQTRFELEVEQTGQRVRVEVTDSGGGSPTMRFPSPEEPTGRGLQIVDMLSEDWGVDQRMGSGKTVWFTVSADAGNAERSGPECESADEVSGHALPGGRLTRRRKPTPWTFVAV